MMMEEQQDWRRLGRGLEAWFQADSHARAAALAVAIVDLVPDSATLPDMEVRATGVRVGVAVGADARYRGAGLPAAISEAARMQGLMADPSVLQRVGVRIDSADPATLTGFWRTVGAYLSVDGADADADVLTDDLRRRPTVALAGAVATSPLRNRLHVDVVHPGPTGDAVAAALAAGGREAFTSQWYSTLADPDGNEVDLVPGGPLEGRSSVASTEDWNTLFGAMVCYPTDTPGRAAGFAATVAGLADDANIPLMIDLRPEGMVLDSGKDQWEEVDGFVDLAGAVQAAARAAGLVADNRRLRFVQIAIDAVDIPTVREFWRVVLAYEHAPNQDYFDLFDPRQLNPVLFFQPMDAADVERLRQPGRIRLDLLVPADHLETRVAAAVAAGGRVVEQDPTGRRHRLADPEGNELVLRANPPSAEL